jgi:hemoglobin/transferrin/lactoferrin receptor protein
MKFIHNLVLLFFGLWLVSLNGQTLRIVDAVTGYPIQDVVAYNPEATANTTSDANGRIDLSVFSAEDQVHFEHIGYERLLLPISKLQSTTQLALYPDTQRLGEIVLSVSRTKDEKKRVSKQVPYFRIKTLRLSFPTPVPICFEKLPGFECNAPKEAVGVQLFVDLKPIAFC